MQYFHWFQLTVGFDLYYLHLPSSLLPSRSLITCVRKACMVIGLYTIVGKENINASRVNKTPNHI